jgi:single-strand DNA-binding protein
MNNLNSLIIEGNLVKDPLFRSTPKGTPVCTFTLASERFYKQDSGYEREVSYFDVETWMKVAQQCSDQGHKGRGVRVVGRLKQDRWNTSDGEIRSRIIIVAEHVEFRPEFKLDESNQEGSRAENTSPAIEELADMAAADDQADIQQDIPVTEDMAAVAF